MSKDNRAETLLNTHQKSTKNTYMFTTRDGKVFGTNLPEEVEKLRKAVLRHNKNLARRKS